MSGTDERAEAGPGRRRAPGPRPGAGAAPCTNGPTPWQTVGPYLALGFSPLASRSAAPGAPEARGTIRVTGFVLDGAGVGIPDAVVESWHTATALAAPPGDGAYIHPAGDGTAFFARGLTGPRGEYELVTARPAHRPGGGDEDQAPHLEIVVLARGLLRALRTRVYLPDEAEANERDPVLRAVADPARRATLLAALGDGAYRFDIRIQASGGEPETVFFG